MKKILLTAVLAGSMAMPLMAHADESGYDGDRSSISKDRDNTRSDRSSYSRDNLRKAKKHKGLVGDKSRQHHWGKQAAKKKAVQKRNTARAAK